MGLWARVSIDRSVSNMKGSRAAILAGYGRAVERCAECGFVYADLPQDRIASALRMVAAQYRSRLGSPTAKSRPSPGTWSPIEYAGHVGDVLRVQHERIALAMRFDRPVFEPMDRDRRVAEGRYIDHEAVGLIDEIERGAAQLASLLDDLSADEWARPAIYNWPRPAIRSVTWIGRHTVHELGHHLLDISRAVDPAAGSASG